MDEFKPEDELKPDPSDRRPGRSRKSAEFDNEPQINIDDVDVDAEERRPARSRRAQADETYEADEALAEEDSVQERRPRKRKKAPPKGPISRQHMMMALGILVLVLLIIGIGSALKGPDANKADDAQAQNSQKNIDLSGNAGSPSDQANGAQPQPGDTSAANQTTGNAPQDISLPPVSSTPTQAQNPSAPEGQQRVEVPGDLNNALTQQQGQIDNAVSGSTLPTEPATVAPVNGNAAAPQQPREAAQTQAPARHNASTTRPERKQMVIESEPRKAQTTQTKPQAPAKTTAPEQKPASAPKRSEPATGTASAPVKAPTATATTAPKSAPAASQPSAAASGASAGNVGALKSAPGSHYTLQLSSSSNYNNLNAWAKKESLKNYVVYQTTRNGQPWYVLVSGVYGSKDEAKRAVSSLPADVQAKNPWAKPIHQVQADLK
ncbi:DamX, an inner membrane protein involved in bile resistance [Cronobacter condimenti 1330]|uniref:Cell division protein DamX n=1 Tax=Cronobacter condimenti 1330 TaxID=1073999 RepID=K8A9Z7_9ENTR|nr:cell division protein DamX [Cronobacter condimenti]ALB64374.1 cell division protein DamX [Cronobacter condimenti 1330]CCJ72559.1 DamX, an inner membrane protein involved in bile resistance [Cronobacter condimenti 1330]